MITQNEIVGDVLEFANIVSTDYMPKLKADTDKLEDDNPVKEILQSRYKELKEKLDKYDGKDVWSLETEIKPEPKFYD